MCSTDQPSDLVTEAILRASGLSKTYPGGTRALVGIELTVHAGETVVLIGESGCGKSTLLRMFNRLEQPTAGEVRSRGRQAETRDPIEAMQDPAGRL